MRPYLAVVMDSFRSAFASRILWIAFLAIWLLLAALAPIGFQEVYTTRFRGEELSNGTQLKAMLARGLIDPQEEGTALGRLSAAMPGSLKKQLRTVARQNTPIQKWALADGLNRALDDESWYDQEAWQGTIRLTELKELDKLSEKQITEDQRRRRARLRIEAALPGGLIPRPSRSINLSYAGFAFPVDFPVTKKQFLVLVNQYVIPVMMDWLLGFILVFLGILVTASIIPEMLQPGSLHLLVSKPISRFGLLIAKYIGGCTFVLLCVCQLVVGLWAIAAWRLELWNPAILWCIPVAVFLFAVYFSVSLLAGLQWRSPILSIGVTCLFGGFVLVVGIFGGYFDQFVTGPEQISSMVKSADQLLVTTRGRQLRVFNDQANGWDDLFDKESVRRRDLLVRPVAISDDVFVSAKISGGQYNLYGNGTLEMLVLDRRADYKPIPLLPVPNGTRQFLVFGDQLLAMNNAGLLATPVSSVLQRIETERARLDDQGDDSEPEEEAAEENPEVTDQDLQAVNQMEQLAWTQDLVGNLFRMQGGAVEEFQPILPEEIQLVEPLAATVAAGGKWLVLYSRGRLFWFGQPAPSSDQTTLELIGQLELPGSDAARTRLAASGQQVLVARADEPVRWLDLASGKLVGGKLVGEIEVGSRDSVIDVSTLADKPVAENDAASSGRFAVLTSDGTLHLVERQGDALAARTLGLDDVHSIDFDSDSQRLLVAHDIDQVEIVAVASDGSLLSDRSIRATPAGWRKLDSWVMEPLRTLTPQTGELSETVAGLVSGRGSSAIERGFGDAEVRRYRIWRPVLSCGMFIVAIMSLSCFLFVRRDF